MVDLLLSIVLCYLFTDPVLDKEVHKHLDENLVTAQSFFSKVCEMFSYYSASFSERLSSAD